MESKDLLSDAFSRIQGAVAASVDGLNVDDMAYRPDPDANSVAWLVWHLTRVQDDHICEIADWSQEWVEGGWNLRFGTDQDPSNTGYGHTSDQVAGVVPDSAEALIGYHQAVYRRTLSYLDSLDEAELERIIDHSYDPPVSVGVRLVSVINDNIQHAGQARYVHGLLERR
jgi:uncharacterized damage-inducible protein DinB